jgi:hypothetical protein
VRVAAQKDADKATVFRTAVDYLTFLRNRLSPEILHSLDSEVSATDPAFSFPAALQRFGGG